MKKKKLDKYITTLWILRVMMFLLDNCQNKKVKKQKRSKNK